MNKFVRFVFLPVFFTVFLNGYAWAINLTGAYTAVGVKYVTTSLPACQSATITVRITNQCGRLLKGTFQLGNTTIPVIGSYFEYPGAGSMTLSGVKSGANVFLQGQYVPTVPGIININNGIFHFFAPTSFPYADAIFDNFKLVK